MKLINLGDNKINRIGLGTNFFTDVKKDQKSLIKLLHFAKDFGINFFDTAEIYHQGESEKLIGKAFKKKRSSVIIATKFSPEHAKYKDVLKAAEDSLKRLHSDYIDFYQLHWPNPTVPIEQTIKALEKLVRMGKVKQIGVCNLSLRQLKDFQRNSKLPIATIQTEYNLLERSAEANLLPYCKKNKIIMLAYSPLNSGNIFKDKKHFNFFTKLSKKYQKSISQIILNFLLTNSEVVAIPATTSFNHLKENSKSLDFNLENGDFQLIAKTFSMKIIEIDPKKIIVANHTDHSAYKTIEEALENKLNFFPSPLMLSKDIQKGDFLKAVRVRKIPKKGNFEYELLGGRIRYWAWVIAHNGRKNIPAIIEG